LIGQEADGDYTSYHFDFRGSTVALTDKDAQIIEQYQYSPYGLLLSGDSSKTPFLFNGKYGVMTDSNNLYYMRARFYNPEIKRFINQDILLGGIGEGQTLNRYVFVTGQPISFVDPFGLFGMDDTASMALDFVPVVGSCKGIIEFIIGIDPLTGEPIPRWMSAIGIIPGGKYFTKGGKAGEAIIYLYKGPDRHFSVMVKQGDKSVHTEQIILDDMMTTIDYYADYGDEVRKKFEFDLADAISAMEFQKNSINKNTGIYDIDTNSCLTHVCDTIRAGGANVPPTDGSEKWKKEAYEFFMKNSKK